MKLPDDTFQSSPGLATGSNDGNTWLADAWESFQSSPGLATGSNRQRGNPVRSVLLGFNPLPVLRPGATTKRWETITANVMFQSSPGLATGSNLKEAFHEMVSVPVSILSRSCDREQRAYRRVKFREGAMFQSSPGLATGSNIRASGSVIGSISLAVSILSRSCDREQRRNPIAFSTITWAFQSSPGLATGSNNPKICF